MAKKKIVSLAVNTPLNIEGVHPLYVLGQPVMADGPVVSDIAYKRDAGLDIAIKHDAAYVVTFADNAIQHAIPAAAVVCVGIFDEDKAAKFAADKDAAGIPDGGDDEG
jgi:hypothetical protein